MNRSELRSFHAVAASGGFSAASRELNVSQPTVSVQVKSLEERYGVELFFRSKRRVHLTAAGEELFEITSRIHKAEAEATQVLESFSGLHRGTLSLAAVGPFHATDMIVAYKSRYPAIELQVTFGNSRTCFDRVLSYAADLAIIAEVPSDDRVHTIPYRTHQVVVFVNSSHPFYSRDSVNIEDLAGQPVIRREAGSTTRMAVEAELQKRGIDTQTVLELGSREGIWKAVEQGLGIGFVADFEFVEHPNLRAIPVANADIRTQYFLACLQDRKDTRLVRSFCDVALSAG
ncbi:MAG: LysR substrate-binding domain-containing protein [Paracoccaceae bacterium]